LRRRIAMHAIAGVAEAGDDLNGDDKGFARGAG
jgi:hypothetical protein